MLTFLTDNIIVGKEYFELFIIMRAKTHEKLLLIENVVQQVREYY